MLKGRGRGDPTMAVCAIDYFKDGIPTVVPTVVSTVGTTIGTTVGTSVAGLSLQHGTCLRVFQMALYCNARGSE